MIDLLACFGVALIIISYWRVQWQRDYAKKVTYSLFNLFGGVLLAAPLLRSWNWAVFVVIAVWCAISVYGLHRCIKYLRLQSAQKKWLASRRRR